MNEYLRFQLQYLSGDRREKNAYRRMKRNVIAEDDRKGKKNLMEANMKRNN